MHMDQLPLYVYPGFGGGGGSSGGRRHPRRKMDAFLEVRWFAERSAAARYIVIVISASFIGRGAMRSYAFACPPKPRERHTMLLVESYSVGGGAIYQWQRKRRKGKLAQIVRKCNEFRINDKTKLTSLLLMRA